MQQSRNDELEAIRIMLNTPTGEALLAELSTMWEPPNLMGDTPERTAYNVGLNAALRYIRELAAGSFIHEEG